jgi:hypothetical protein
MQNASDNPSPRQIKKYVDAKNFLTNQFNNKTPPGISARHWDDFKRTIDNAEKR